MWPQTEEELQVAEAIMGQYMSGLTTNLVAVALLSDNRTQLRPDTDTWYMRYILSQLALEIPMEGQTVAPLDNVDIGDMTMDFSDSTDQGPLLTMTASASVLLPFAFPMNLTSIDLEFELRVPAQAAITSATYGANCACEPSNNCICDVITEGDMAVLVCPVEGTVISRVNFASYGEPVWTDTCEEMAVGPNCHSPSSQSVIESKCLGTVRKHRWTRIRARTHTNARAGT